MDVSIAPDRLIDSRHAGPPQPVSNFRTTPGTARDDSFARPVGAPLGK